MASNSTGQYVADKDANSPLPLHQNLIRFSLRKRVPWHEKKRLCECTWPEIVADVQYAQNAKML